MAEQQPSYNTYASFVSKKSVWIALFVVALHDLDMIAGDISNACLYAHTKEKVWFRAGSEFGAQ